MNEELKRLYRVILKDKAAIESTSVDHLAGYPIYNIWTRFEYIHLGPNNQ